MTVFTRFGSFTDVGDGGDTSGAAACADGCGAVDARRCAARDRQRDRLLLARHDAFGRSRAPMRSWNGLPDWPSALAAVAAAGTVFAGVGSALMTGGLDDEPEPDVKAR